MPSGRSRTDRASGILHPVLLPDTLASLRRHRPPLLVDAERDLLEVLLAALLTIPCTKDLRPVPTSAEVFCDQLDFALLWPEAAEVRPLVGHPVHLPPQLDDTCARPVAIQDFVDSVGEVAMWPRWLRFRCLRLHFALHSDGQIR